MITRFPTVLSQRGLKVVEDQLFDGNGFARSTGEHIRIALLHDEHELRIKATAFRRARELHNVLLCTDRQLAAEMAEVLDLFARSHEIDTYQRQATIEARKDNECCHTHWRLVMMFFQLIREWCEALRYPRAVKVRRRPEQLALSINGPDSAA